MVMIRKIGTLEYDRNQINRDGIFSAKPAHRGTWSSIGYAKGHIAQIFNDGDCTFPAVLDAYMNAEFVVLDDDYVFIEAIPVKDYFLEKMKEFAENGPKMNWFETERQRKRVKDYLTSIGIDVIIITQEQKKKIEIEKFELKELARLKAKYEK